MSEITIASKDLAISSARLVNKLTVHSNQSIASIDRRGNSDREFPFRSWKSGNVMTVDFGWNADDRIVMNPSRTIGNPHLQITRTSLSNCNILELVIRCLSWHGTMKSKSENLVGNLRSNKMFKMLSAQIIPKLKRLVTNIL